MRPQKGVEGGWGECDRSCQTSPAEGWGRRQNFSCNCRHTAYLIADHFSAVLVCFASRHHVFHAVAPRRPTTRGGDGLPGLSRPFGLFTAFYGFHAPRLVPRRRFLPLAVAHTPTHTAWVDHLRACKHPHFAHRNMTLVDASRREERGRDLRVGSRGQPVVLTRPYA